MKLLLSIFLLLLALPLLSQEPAPSPLSALRSGKADSETLADVLPLLASEKDRPAVLAALGKLDPFPRAALVPLLSHGQIAVRLAALELLEERAGGDFDFDPWLPPGDPANQGPLAHWQSWLDSNPDSKTPGNHSLLDDDQRRGYLRDLLGKDPDKTTRARHMLEADGLAAVGFLEEFLESNPTLPPGSRAKIRQAQYQIVLSRSLGRQATTLARNLAFGNRDQLLAALASIKGAGLNSLPILSQFLEHQDPLVRETTIDAMLATGGTRAMPMIEPVLLRESDINVIHGALRRIKDIRTPESLKLVARFLDHPDEDLLVSAIHTCLSLTGSSDSFSFSSSSRSRAKPNKSLVPVFDAIIQRIDDPRWRVRTAALEFVAARKVTKAADAVLRHLEDDDNFVRFAAIKAAAALSLNDALPKLKSMLMANAELADAVLLGYGAMNKSLDDEIIAFLKDAPPETRVAAIRAAHEFSILSPLVLTFSNDENLDVACAALRYLAEDDDRVADPDIASTLVAALRSGQQEKCHAIVDRLSLPKSKSIDSALLESLGRFADTGEPTALDPLYDAFLETKSDSPDKPDESRAPRLTKAQQALADELAKLTESADSELAFSAALALARAGHPEGFLALATRLPSLSTAQKIAIGNRLYSLSTREAIPLLRMLLRDPVSEVRSEAASAALSSDNFPALAELVFEELTGPDAAIQPHEIYGYRFESIARSRTCAKVVRGFAVKTLKNTNSPPSLKVLAAIALRYHPGGSNFLLLESLGKSSPNPLVRRAAWFTIGTSSPTRLRKSAKLVAEDASPLVREVLPVTFAGEFSRSQWLHRFSDLHTPDDDTWSSSSRIPRLSPEIQKSLELLAAADPSPIVRFECLFTLMVQGRKIDLDEMIALLPRQPKQSFPTARIINWFERNASRIGPGLRPLFAAIDTSRIDSDKLKIIERKLGADQSAGFASFAALAKQDSAGNDEQQQQATEATDAPPVAAKRTSLPLIFFVKPGCKECAEVSDLIQSFKKDFPLLDVSEISVAESRGIVLNQALCDRFRVPAKDHSVTPAIFTRAGFLVHTDIVPKDLGRLLSETMPLPQDDSWKDIDEPEIAAAGKKVESRFASLTFWVVLTGGLLDGINPCAFATIIFFLSYLQIARRTPREMLLTGVAFISAVFIAYFTAGLLLYKILEVLHNRFGWLQQWLNWSMAALALVAAFLSFRDAARARAGHIDEMTLQLPGFLKSRIRGVIRTGARARRFVIAAFLAGIAISFLELACTGQIYVPIIYQIQQGRLDAVAWLVLYNLAFILPLVVIFLLAYAGLRSESLIDFQKRHTTAVKIGLGLVFFALAALILFGHKILPSS